MENLEIAIKVFSVLGEAPKDFTNSRFKFYLVPNWQTPSFSPIILMPGESIDRSNLESIEEYFRKHPIRNCSLKNVPYFNFFKGEGFYDVKAIESMCEKFNWIIDSDPLKINLLKKPIPLNLPQDFYFVVRNSFDAGISDDYKDILRSNFNANEKYIEYVETVFKNKMVNSYTMLIYSQDGHPVGGGTVSIRNGLAFFTWGAVNERYRKKGFHQLLLAVCKMIATSYNVKVCGYTTRNKFIKNKCDSSVEMYICRKKK